MNKKVVASFFPKWKKYYNFIKNNGNNNKLILVVLLCIWLIGLLIDRFWFSLDHSMPGWDQADYLNGVKIYYQALKNIDIFNGEWWRSFWLLSNKIPPLTYIITAPFFFWFGISEDSGTLVLSLFSLVLLISLFYLGKLFFNTQIALFSCALVNLIPGLYFYRLEFLLDYPLTAIVTFSFTCLSYWYFSQRKSSWWLTIIWGLSLGISLMIKQTALFFLFFPILFVFVTVIIRKRWLKLSQLILSFLVSTLIFFPWYRTNWLLIFTSGKRATIDSAIAEGDPALNTLQAWTYYAEVLPYLLSWVLFAIPLICLIYLIIKYLAKGNLSLANFKLYLTNNFYQYNSPNNKPLWLISGWLLTFLIGGYLLSSLNINKDARYILPLIPVLCLILSALIYSYRGNGKLLLRSFTLALALLLMCLNLFPLGGNFLTEALSPKVKHYPYIGEKWANPKVIEEVIKTSPYLRSNIGVLPSTPQINQHNISFFGAINNSQVFGRQVGTREKNIVKDVASFDWFLTKTGDQGSIPEAQKKTVNLVEKGGDFKLQKSWQLPDKSQLNLYQRILPINQSLPLNSANSKVELAKIIVDSQLSSGQVIPITYQWSGSAKQLKDGIVILTWRSQDNPEQKWIHDHGIGMGNIHQGKFTDEEFKQDLLVIENTAMFVPENLAEGKYILEAIYLNRQTGETYPINTSKIAVEINNSIEPKTTNKQLDLVSQIRQFAPNLKYGIDGLAPVFAEVGRINQYDPIQDYLKVTEKSLQYRLQSETNLDDLYTLLLSQALQQKIESAITESGAQSAIATSKQIIKQDPNNAYNHAYLAFIYLYDWRGKEAEKALQPAFNLQPDLDVLQYLDGISAIMQGNLPKAWQVYQRIKMSSKERVSSAKKNRAETTPTHF